MRFDDEDAAKEDARHQMLRLVHQINILLPAPSDLPAALRAGLNELKPRLNEVQIQDLLTDREAVYQAFHNLSVEVDKLPKSQGRDQAYKAAEELIRAAYDIGTRTRISSLGVQHVLQTRARAARRENVRRAKIKDEALYAAILNVTKDLTLTYRPKFVASIAPAVQAIMAEKGITKGVSTRQIGRAIKVMLNEGKKV